ncbi:MAG: hypothetical protein WD771_07740 [Gemmatimonadaceae bacterium]
MPTNRREFLDRLTLGAAALGGLTVGLGAVPERLAAAGIGVSGGSDWDTAWPDRLTGSVRSVFDVPEVESGFGVWRASIWAAQYDQASVAAMADCSTALVLRHNAIILAMSQEYWDRYDVAKQWNVTHPLTGQPTLANPALLGAADGIPEPFAGYGLRGFMRRGGVVLACDLALGAFIVPKVQQVDGVSPEVARARAIGHMHPGVILQPSGVFSVILAQQKKQAHYIRAS